MKNAERYALDAAKEITLAALENGSCFQNDSGVSVAEYIGIVYEKVLKLAKQVPDD